MFLDCQSFCSQGTVPIRETLLIASFHVQRWHLGLGYVFSVCDTLFWWKKPVSRAGNRGKTYHFVRDTDFCAVKGVSRHETWLNDRETARDTRFNVEKGVSRQGKVVGKRTATGKSGVSRSRSGSGRGQMEAEVGIERSRGRIERTRGGNRGKQREEVNRHETS